MALRGKPGGRSTAATTATTAATAAADADLPGWCGDPGDGNLSAAASTAATSAASTGAGTGLIGSLVSVSIKIRPQSDQGPDFFLAFLISLRSRFP